MVGNSHELTILADELLVLSKLPLEPNAWSPRSLPKQRECAGVAGPGRVRLVLPPAGPPNTGVKLRSSIMLGFVSFNSLLCGLVHTHDSARSLGFTTLPRCFNPRTLTLSVRRAA